jgi:arabinofuranosyltransferase
MIPDKNTWRALIALLIAMLLFFVIRRAWISDDAMITFRTVDNFLNGYGLRWNIIERVQTYTNPLWLFVLAIVSIFTGNISFSAIIVSLACTLTTALLIVRNAISSYAAVLGVGILALSGIFVNYSTSGLENPLTMLLLVVFLTLLVRQDLSNRDLFLLSFVSSLGLVNRMDTGLIYAPMLLYVFMTSPRKLQTLLLFGLGQFPFISWEIFSVIYYGFPFPNTFYAKVGMGISSRELMAQGFVYFMNSLDFDPLTIFVIVLGILSSFFRVNRGRNLAVSLGIFLYLLYIIRVGGDFMSGRFFATPLIVAVFLLINHKFLQEKLQPFVSLLAVVILLGLANPSPSFLIESHDYPTTVVNGITNERELYFEYGWLRQSREEFLKSYDSGTPFSLDFAVVDGYAIGRRGLYSGPHTHIIDNFGLGDPLLSRLPAHYRTYWVIGHFTRTVPDGYEQTLQYGYNQLEDKDLALYYDKIMHITRAPIWSIERFRAIVDMNLGRYDYLINDVRYRFAYRVDRPLADIEKIFAGDPSVVLDQDEVCDLGIPIVNTGVLIRLPNIYHTDMISMQIGGKSNPHQLILRQNGEDVGSIMLPNMSGHIVVTIPKEVAQQGYDQFHLMPVVETPPKSLCMYSLNFDNYSNVFNHILTELSDVTPEDLVVIQASDMWQEHFVDEVELLEQSIFSDVPTVYLQSMGWTRAINHPDIQNMDSFDSRAQVLIREQLVQGGQVWVVNSNQLPLSYPLASLFANEATLIDTIVGELGKPYTINIFEAQ